MKRTNIYLSDKQTKELNRISKQIDITKSELIRRAVDEFIEKHYKKK